jgi:hypothetical protein
VASDAAQHRNTSGIYSTGRYSYDWWERIYNSAHHLESIGRLPSCWRLGCSSSLCSGARQWGAIRLAVGDGRFDGQRRPSRPTAPTQAATCTTPGARRRRLRPAGTQTEGGSGRRVTRMEPRGPPTSLLTMVLGNSQLCRQRAASPTCRRADTRLGCRRPAGARVPRASSSHRRISMSA